MSFIDGVLAKVFGTKTDREVKAMLPTVAAIGALEPEFRELSDIDLAAKTIEFKEQIAQGATLDDLMIPAFAVVREAGRRVLNMRHFDVQLIGGMVLHKGKVAYNADITYGTNNEFGFDYLRDNMKFRIEDCVQRVHNYAIVDEVDSILIDEARTPLIISGPSEESTDKYYKINRIIPKLTRGEVIEGKEPGEKYTAGDYTIDEKHKSSALTEEGVLRLEKLLNIGNLYDPQNIEWNHHVQQALRAHVLYQRDREYVVRDGDEGPEVVIVDEFTGRLMPGRRWSDGLHQAVEAKEGVKIQRENQTLATITFQNYFRMYKKLAGMTGTAETEAAE